MTIVIFGHMNNNGGFTPDCEFTVSNYEIDYRLKLFTYIHSLTGEQRCVSYKAVWISPREGQRIIEIIKEK